MTVNHSETETPMPDRKFPLDDITPYPRRAADVTAGGLARHSAAFAQLHHCIATDHPDSDVVEQSLDQVVAYYGITYLLRELIERAGTRQADEVARTLWAEWDTGSGMGPDIWGWLSEDYGIDPERINRLAQQIIADDLAGDPHHPTP